MCPHSLPSIKHSLPCLCQKKKSYTHSEERSNIDIKSKVSERRGNDLAASVMAVLADLGHEDARAAPFRGLELLCNKKRSVLSIE